jgi:nicotinate dehydrogenase subunit A
MPTYDLRINGFARSIDSSDPEKPLLYALRGLGLTATKFGCGLGQCGACIVLVDGKAVPSCQMTIANAQGKKVTTLEGLGSISTPHPIQAAFIKEQVPQCGYCTSGMIMSAAALLSEKQKPSEADVRSALDRNLCRCGTHVRVLRAVMAASGQGG